MDLFWGLKQDSLLDCNVPVEILLRWIDRDHATPIVGFRPC